ncbi:MAG TPA: hypothetical protein VFX50_13385, partial [Gemmatimonadales bacterium]|nr:hypothetical protein [Gemmatimonadales bacterium]
PVTPSSGQRVEVVSAPASGLAGEPLPDPVLVRVVDEQGRGVPGVPLRWSARDGSVTPAADTSGLDGLAAAHWSLMLASGENRLSVSVADEPATRVVAEGRALEADAVDAGVRAACALRAGDAWCWGMLFFLGGGFSYSATPVRISDGLQLRELVISDLFVCALDGARRLRCRGQGIVGPAAPPTAGAELALVEGVPPLRDLRDADRSVCGIAVADSTGWCVHFTSSTNVTYPQGAWQVSPALRFRAISPGGGLPFACGIDSDGSAWCWGNNDVGQLGDGTTTSSLEPVRVPLEAPLRDADAGGHYACALDDSFAVWCWGSYFPPFPSPPPGPRPLMAIVDSPTPVRLGGILAQQISAGFRSLMILSAGELTEQFDPSFRSAIAGTAALGTRAVAADDDWCLLSGQRRVYCSPGAARGFASLRPAFAVPPHDLEPAAVARLRVAEMPLGPPSAVKTPSSQLPPP